MPRIELRFYEELNDFLPPASRKTTMSHTFDRIASVKDMIESFGVPHPEVEIILVNGQSVDFSYLVQDGDRISVYPEFESLDISPLLRLRPQPLRHPKFILDSNLGRLAGYLRLMGFDCLYQNYYDDQTIANISSTEHRIILTRDRTLLQRKIITHGHFVREVLPGRQVKEVLARFDLYRLVKPFCRCTRCNGELQDVDKKQIIDRLEPKTKKYYDTFLICPSCRQIYWEGSHHQRSKLLIDTLTRKNQEIARMTSD